MATVELPSSGQGGDLAADAAVVRAAIESSDEPAILVGHSYGGVVITEAAAGLPQVRHLVYLAAFLLDAGESLLGVIGGPPPWFVPSADGSTVLPDDPRTVFYLDVEPGVAAAAATQLQPQSLAAFNAPLSQAAWHTIPSTYIACTQDQAIPYPAQQAMSGRAGSVHTLQASHSPFLSQPEVVAGLIAEAA